MSKQYDSEKARNAILYICHKMQTASGFGSVLLNKVLYYIDHASYLKTGEKLTGFSYIKQRRGPTPAPNEFLPLRDEMLAKKEMREREVEKFGRIQKRSIALVKPNLNLFQGSEVALMDEIIEELGGMNATEASDLSHELMAWQMADLMEPLPAYTYLLSRAELNEADIAWGRKVADRFKNAPALA